MIHRPSMFVRIFGASVRHPRATLLLALLCVGLSILGTRRLHATGSIAAMLPAADPSAAALTRITNEFGVMDNLILLASDVRGDASPRDRVDRLRSFAERLEQAIRGSDELRELCADVAFRDFPEMRAFIEHEMVPAGLYYLDEPQLARLREQLTTEGIQRQIRENEDLVSASGAAAHTLSKLILRDPLRLYETLADAAKSRFGPTDSAETGGLSLSLDRSTLMIRLTGVFPASDLDFSRRFLRVVSAESARLNVESLHIEYTGAYAIAVEAERSIRADMIRSIMIAVVALGLLFLVAYRGFLSFPIAIVPVAFGILCAFGLSSFYSTELTPLVAVLGAVLSGLAIDYSIHFLTHYGCDVAAGLSTAHGLHATIADVGPPMMVACVTSMVGFLTDFASNVPALRQLAVIGALGLACSILAALTLLPAMLTELSSLSKRLGRPRTGNRPLSALLAALNARSLSSIGIAASVFTLLLVASAYSRPGGSRFDSDLTGMHPQPNPPLDAQRSIAKRFGRDPDALIVHLRSDSGSNLLRLAYRLDERLRTSDVARAGLTGSLGPATLLPDPDQVQARLTTDQVFDVDRTVADFEAAIENSMFDSNAYRDYAVFLRELLGRKPAPDLATLLRYPSVARLMLPSSAMRGENAPAEAIAVLFLDRPLDSRTTRDQAIHAVRTALDGLPGATLTGVAVVTQRMETLMWGELRRLLLIVIAGVVLCSFAYFQQPLDTFLSLLPAIFGVGCLLGAMNLIDLRLNMINLVGIPLSLGLGVDGGVFLVSLAATHRRQGGSRQLLTERIGVGCHAIVITTATTVISFGTLVFTSTPAIRSLGEMMAIGTVACLVGAVFLLAPILLLRADRPGAAIHDTADAVPSVAPTRHENPMDASVG